MLRNKARNSRVFEVRELGSNAGVPLWGCVTLGNYSRCSFFDHKIGIFAELF